MLPIMNVIFVAHGTNSEHSATRRGGSPMSLSTGSYFAFVDIFFNLTWKSHACKGRFQISYDRDRKTQGVDDGVDTETRHCIRNFRLMLTVCINQLKHCFSLTS